MAHSLIFLTPLHDTGYWTSAAALVTGLAIAAAHGWNIRLGRFAKV